MNIGLHYTVGTAWEKIRVEGLVPQKVTKPEILAVFPRGLKASYIYTLPQDPHAHLSLLIDRGAKHKCWDVLLLAVFYSDEDVVQGRHGQTVEFSHHGVVCEENQWPYHVNEPMVLLDRTIASENLVVVGRWDLLRLLRAPEMPWLDEQTRSKVTASS